MCIRDSHAGRRGADYRGEVRQPREEVRLRAGLESGRHQGCLLYTSDAADERSSVDLGGRRIIKKKTPAAMPHRVPKQPDNTSQDKPASAHITERHTKKDNIKHK